MIPMKDGKAFFTFLVFINLFQKIQRVEADVQLRFQKVKDCAQAQKMSERWRIEP